MSRAAERFRREWPWIAAALIVAAVLAALDPAGAFVSGWLAYAALFLLAGLVLRLTWGWLAPGDASRSLVFAVATSIVLRLGVGIVFDLALPTLGYPESDSHARGYYFLDAYHRDRDAWRIAGDDAPLAQVFTNPERTDQYGGLLFLSIAAYRALSPEVHRQLLVVGAAAVASAMAVLFGWGFANRALGAAPAIMAAWIMAAFPEAVFLGASPMRESFLIAGLAASLYGYVLFRSGEQRIGLATMLIALTVTALFSPPYAFLFAVTLLVARIWEGSEGGAKLTLAIGAVVAIALVLTLVAWSQIGNAPQGSALGIVDWWVNSGAQFELDRLERGSGIVQKYFELVPEWAHMPLATAYGLVQPFLPAALMDASSLPFPRVLGVLRGLGWFALLPMLIYAPFAAVRAAGWRSLTTYFSLLIWLIAVGAAYRLAGDQWDNPRARTVFLAVQAGIAGWAWYQAKRSHSPWLRRTAIVVAVSTLVFLQWYAGRYYGTPRLDLYQTVGTIVAFTMLFIVVAFLWDRRRLTANTPEV